MPQKNAIIRLIDNFLMAPYRVMDRDGGDPYRFEGDSLSQAFKRGLNILNFPETKAIALAAVFLSAGMNVNDAAEKIILPAKVVLLGAAFMGIRRKMEHPVLIEDNYDGPDYFIDSNPGGVLSDLSEEIETDLMLRKKMAVVSFRLQTGVAAGLGGLGLYMMGDPLPALLAVPHIVSSAGFYYRAERVLNGDWDVLEQKPERDREFGIFAPSPG